MRFIRNDSTPKLPGSQREFLDRTRDPQVLTSHIVGDRPEVRDRAYGLMYLSQIDSVCPREYVIGNLQQENRREVVSFPLSVIFNMGSALHSWVQNHPEVYFGVKNVLGFWHCTACQRTRRFGVKPFDPCEFCGASHKASVYKEYAFRLKDKGVSGKTDLILKVGSKYRFAEMKFMAKEIDSPIGSDVVQLSSYMYFSKFDIDGLPIDIDRSIGYLVYVNKLFNFRAPIKTFKVEPTERLMNPIIEKSRQFVEGIATSVLPEPKAVCVRKSFYFAKNKTCPMLDTCKTYFFEGKNKYEKF